MWADGWHTQYRKMDSRCKGLGAKIGSYRVNKGQVKLKVKYFFTFLKRSRKFEMKEAACFVNNKWL